MGSDLPGSASADGDEVPANFVERIGAALVAPRLAVRHVSERVGTDAALLLVLAFVVVHTREAVAAGWLLGVDTLAAGGMALATALSRAISIKLAFLFGAGVLIWLGSGRGRSFSRGFDHAAVALVPVVFVEVFVTLISRAAYASPPQWLQRGTTVVAFAWGLAVAVLAMVETRRHGGDVDGVQA